MINSTLFDSYIEKIWSNYPSFSVDGGLSQWGKWGECSQTCGNGTRSRSRSCTSPPPLNGGRECQGTTMDVSPCYNDEPCGNINFCDKTWIFLFLIHRNLSKADTMKQCPLDVSL